MYNHTTCAPIHPRHYIVNSPLACRRQFIAVVFDGLFSRSAAVVVLGSVHVSSLVLDRHRRAGGVIPLTLNGICGRIGQIEIGSRYTASGHRASIVISGCILLAHRPLGDIRVLSRLVSAHGSFCLSPALCHLLQKLADTGVEVGSQAEEYDCANRCMGQYGRDGVLPVYLDLHRSAASFRLRGFRPCGEGTCSPPAPVGP
ncbi:hypothetical protein FKP32DRAFT_959715 [Trametes sanguinea]|nr:hypothetical protein FKP32DRAFT_959715 [Trametes sanguinea]